MTTIFIDGDAYEVDSEKNLLDVCLSLGMDLPYFCWHPAMGSVGACRQCAVKQFRDENDARGQLVMACMTPAADGTRISLKDPDAVEFRASVIEWLMINHPHDCPVCDEGGECHLQDMTVMTGHTYRRYRFNKRTYLNQYLGPFINHEMNRCIQCYRCVRFYRDYADGRDFDVFGAHDHVYFGRHQDGVLESEFSGNLVEICPTGVFTDKTLKDHYTRKWDLQTAPSICTLCSVGCNTIPGERYGFLRRIRNRYNRAVNGYFICDRGRYGYEFVNSSNRIRRPHLRQRREAPAVKATPDEAIHFLRQSLERGRVVGIGSPRASLEANFALRTLVGPAHFATGIAAHEQQLLQATLEMLQQGPARSPSLREIEEADAIFVLGEDLTNTAPMLAYAVRQAVRTRPHHAASERGIPLWNDYAIRDVVQADKGPLFLATLAATKLEDSATQHYHAAPEDIARLGLAIAHALDKEAPAVARLSHEDQALAEEIAEALREARRPIIISGTGCGHLAVIQAAANVAWALQKGGAAAGLSFALPEANSLGIALLGGQDLETVRQMLDEGAADTLIVLENDLYRRAEPVLVDALLNAAGRVVVLDHLETPTTARADLVLPAATFAESDGTLVNQEGRAQRFLQVFVPQGDVKESWRWLQDMIGLTDSEVAGHWQELDDVLAALAAAMPALSPLTELTPPSDYRIAGQKIPRQPHRYSGRTAITAHLNVSEPEPPQDADTAMTFTMEGYKGPPPPSLLPRYWAPGWNSVQALNKFQSEVGGPLKGGDPGRRLIEPAAGAATEPATSLRSVQALSSLSEAEWAKGYDRKAPEPFRPRDGHWLVVPLYHIYGSEELSMLAPGVAQLAPQPYLALNQDDAGRLQALEGEVIVLDFGSITSSLPLRIVPSLPRGVAGLPVGLPGLPYIHLPRWSRLMKREGSDA